MKKKIMMLSCIAACAFVSGYVGMKACESYVVYPVSKCCASHEGAGIIRGNNIDMNYGYPIKRIPIPCEGDKFHIRIEDIMGDYFEKSDPYGEL